MTARGVGDSRRPTTGDPKYWDAQAANGNLQRGNQAVADFYGEKLNQLTPTQIGTYQTYENEKNSSLFDKLAPAIALAAMSAGIAAPVGAAVGGAAGGGFGGAVAGGAAAGGVSSGLQGLYTGNLSAKSVGTGILGGALGGSLNYAGKELSSSLTQNGINPNIANGVVKVGTGAIGGAVSGGLSGQGAGAGALSGAIRGGISAAGSAVGGGTSSSTGSPFLGSLAGGLTGVLGSAAAGSLLGGRGSTASTGGSNFLGQGNSGNMAGTDTILAGTIGGALPGVIQGAAGVYGSQNAAEKMTQADQNAIGTQQSTLGNINSIWQTQQNLGQGADTALGRALGTNGQPADYSGFENTPGYKFAVSQGTQAIQRQAASMGNAYTPNTAAAVGQYVTGTASQNYNNYISQLMGAAGLGSTANTGIAQPTYQTGANISQLQQNQGYAQASGVSGGANAIGGMFGPSGVGSSLIGAAAKYLGSGTGSSGGGGSRSGGNIPSYIGQDSNMFGGNEAGYTGYIPTNIDPNTGMTATFENGDYGFGAPPADISSNFGGSLDYGSGFNSDEFNFLGGP